MTIHNRTSMKAFLKRWFFPCTLLVLVYLVYCLVLLLFHDSVRVTSIYVLEFLQPDGSYKISNLPFMEIGLWLLIGVTYPEALRLWEEGKFLPSSPRRKRRAIILGYVVFAVLFAIDCFLLWKVMSASDLSPPTIPLFSYCFSRIHPCLFYLYLCGVANWPFEKQDSLSAELN